MTDAPPPPGHKADQYTPMVPPPAVVFTLIFLLVCLPLNMVLDAVVPNYDPRPGFLVVGALIALCLGVPIGRYWRNGGAP